MKRLNNKGFASSTIMYGVLTLLILLLFSIFSIMKSTKDMNTGFIAKIEKKMNECIQEEMVLESCYFSGGVCDAAAYHACMGLTE